MKILSEYISNWKQIEGIKPCNDPDFIEEFSKMLPKLETCDISYDGDGSYFGQQVSVVFGSYGMRPDRNLCFEIAYSQDEIRVYDGNNEGFWTPEYLSLKKGQENFDTIKELLFSNLMRLFGLS